MFGYKKVYTLLLLTTILISVTPRLSLGETLDSEDKSEMWIPKIDELIGSPLENLIEPGFLNYFPRMNIQELSTSYLVEAELPGVKKDEVEIKLKDNYLIIRGEKKRMTNEMKKNYRRIERSNGTFYRSVSLPKDIDANKVTAELKDGILKVEIGRLKNAPASSEKQIYIK